MNINEKIFSFLELQGIKQKEIADELGVPQPTISYYSTGKREMPLSFLLWFINKYNPNLDSLFDSNSLSIVAEKQGVYKVKQPKKESIDAIMKDVEKVLKKHLN